MKTHSTIRRTALATAGAALAAAALIPAAAQAQTQRYDQQGYYYDPCQRDQSGRSVAGALIGGLAGMALGNNIVNDQRIDRWGRRRDNDTGATVGALVGAGIGASIGRDSAACVSSRQAAQPQRYGYAPGYNGGYQAYGNTDYYGRPYREDYYYDRYQQAPTYAPPPAYGYDQGYYDQGYNSGRACTYVESRVRLPGGRTETRMVQACPDSRGQYQIVD